MIRARCPALLPCILLAAVAGNAGAAAADDYAYAWPLQAAGSEPAWQVELTPEVYAAAGNGLHDVAVVNAAGDAVPAAPYHAPFATTVDALIAIPVFELPAAAANAPSAGTDAIQLQIERGADGRLRRIDANVGAPAGDHAVRADLLLDASAVRDVFAALRLDWSGGEDASAQFAVDASDDLQSWRRIVARATVLHLTRNGDALDRHEIALEHARAAYLRVRRLDDGPALADLGVRLRTTAPASAARSARLWLTASLDGADTRHVDSTLPAGDGQRPVAYRYHLPAALAIDALKLELADDNSLARVHVLSRWTQGETEHWLPRADFVAFRLKPGDLLVGNDESAIAPAAPAREWRVEAATPLEHAPVLTVAYLPDRFVFLAQGAGPFRLVAGSARAQRGEYPLDAALASLRAGKGRDWQPPLATLAARTTLQGERALVPAAAARDWKSWLLWAVLIGAAALVGGLAVSLLRAPKSKA